MQVGGSSGTGKGLVCLEFGFPLRRRVVASLRETSFGVRFSVMAKYQTRLNEILRREMERSGRKVA